MLPLTTTRVDLYRPLIADEDVPVARSAYRHNLSAVVHSDVGQERTNGGQTEDVIGRLDIGIDPGLAHWDQVYDRKTGRWWEVTWVRARKGLGLDHVEAGLRQTQGASIG